MIRWFNKWSRKQLLFVVPRGYMNFGVTVDNYLIGDRNNSVDMDTIRIPLPEGKWRVWRHIKKEVILSAC